MSSGGQVHHYDTLCAAIVHSAIVPPLLIGRGRMETHVLFAPRVPLTLSSAPALRIRPGRAPSVPYLRALRRSSVEFR